MIKLNNKNITYVALADTNNSLKAPKEIWYADSSNSVKLVYRRKDALIEEVDYEVHQWLKTTLNLRGTYMTLPVNSDNLSFKRIISSVANSSWMVTNGFSYFSYSTTGDKPLAISCWDSNQLKSVFWLYKKFDEEIEVVSTSNSLTFGGTSTEQYGYPIQNVSFSNGNNGTSEFKTSSIYVDGVERYIPCKLLKPVPKWLDANGIRRQVGECGMIDLVSGKFYGNVNSVGTFSVENYYERKEWLQGRNGAYIDTNYYPIVGTDVFSVHFRYDGTLRNPDETEQDAFGASGTNLSGGRISAYINGENYLSCNYGKILNGYFPSTNKHSLDWNVSNLRIDGENFKYDANDKSYSFSNREIPIVTGGNTLYVFSCNQSANTYLHGDISSFKITDTSSNTKMNLIPCTLTMDLPASMDANNIARVKGESGMWDLVSDRFYGNVASSGTFKAVNLAEGVDYEVHQWIIGDNVAYIDGLDYNLWQNTLQIQIGKVDGNCQYFGLNLLYNSQTQNGSFFQLMSSGGKFKTYFRDRINGQGWVGWFNLNNMPSVVAFEYYIEDNKAVAIVNGVKTYDTVSSNTLTESVWNKYVPLNTKDGNNIYTKLAKVSYIRELLPNGTYRSNLIPVKLLRSLPSKYDANGIARQAGECGMYDTVNDVFYGNVASSGTFSVSDDS